MGGEEEGCGGDGRGVGGIHRWMGEENTVWVSPNGEGIDYMW